MPISDYATSKTAEQDGVVQTYGDFWIKIARAGGSNKKYAKTMERKTEKYRRAIELNKLPDEKFLELFIEIYAEAVVLDWGGEGMVDENGAPIPCTREKVIEVFTQYPDLFSAVSKDAQRLELFQQQDSEADSGN